MAESIQQEIDIKFMRESLRQARKGLGRTSPNPAVGAVIVRDGQAIADFEAKDWQCKAGESLACSGKDKKLYTKCKHCKPNAMLIVLLRDVPRLAYYQIATTSIHNIVNLTKQMTFIKQTVGRLQGVPFILKLEAKNISVPKDDGGRIRTKKYLLSLEVDPKWMKRLLQTQEQLADPQRQLLLDAPVLN